MNRKQLYILLIFVLFLAGCGEKHDNVINTAYQFVDVNPDSTLTLLDNIDYKQLDKREKAKYALTYTIAQDKSGLDVDNDSLLSIAFNYYRNRKEDSLFAKCMYYMGKYYALNSKTESAIVCYEKAVIASEKQGDEYTKCLALEKISVLHRETDPQKAINEANKALIAYSSLNKNSAINKFYYTINLADAYLYADSLNRAESKCYNAIAIAKQLNDNDLLSYAYQDLAVILRKQGKFHKSLDSSKTSYNTADSKDNNIKINLASAYLDVDSIKQCLTILNDIVPDSPIEKYTLLYLQHICSIKEDKSAEAILFADSAYKQLEQMYSIEQRSKEDYYTALTNTFVERRMIEEKSEFQNKLFTLIISFSLVLLSAILYSYRQYRGKVKLQRQKDKLEREAEKRLHEEEMRRKDLQLAIQKAKDQKELETKMLEEDLKKKELQFEVQKAEAARELDKQMHDEKMKHREIQLATMRKYILSKINIAKKIEQLKGNKEKSVALTDEEWEEIRIFIDNTEDSFVFRLKEKYSELTDDDIKFMMLIRLNMPSKAMAQIYGISDKSICQKLFVYKSKVGIDKEKKSLREFILKF